MLASRYWIAMCVVALMFGGGFARCAARAHASGSAADEPPQSSPPRPKVASALAREWEARAVSLCVWARCMYWDTGVSGVIAVPALEGAILAAGREETARSLRELRDGLGRDDPLRIAVSFTMAWLDMDYQRSRDAVIFYNRSIGRRPPVQVDWEALVAGQRHWQSLLDAEAQELELRPPLQATALIGPEDMPAILYVLWLRHQDTKLVTELLAMGPRTDGALAAICAHIYYTLLASHPRAFLSALRPMPDQIWTMAAHLISGEMRAVLPGDEFAAAGAIASSAGDSLQPTARRWLDLLSKTRLHLLSERRKRPI